MQPWFPKFCSSPNCYPPLLRTTTFCHPGTCCARMGVTKHGSLQCQLKTPQSSGWFAPSPCNILSQPLAIIPQGSPIYEDYEDPMLNKEGFPTVGIGKG